MIPKTIFRLKSALILWREGMHTTKVGRGEYVSTDLSAAFHANKSRV
jgi:hypothetical protein